MNNTRQRNCQVPNEFQECRAFYRWASYNPPIGDYLVKIPNEGRRSLAEGMHLNSIGLKKGFPDYFLVIPNEKYHGLFIEMKRINARIPKISPQHLWIEKLNKSGYYATFCHGWQEAAFTVKQYIENKL